jgi:4-hydroxythreonine-4-phosphate dehydrogenase
MAPLAHALNLLGMPPPAMITTATEAKAHFRNALPVLPPRGSSLSRTDAVIDSIRAAVQLTSDGQTAAMVTNPINKKRLYEAGFDFPGHTEFLAHLTGTENPVMMLAIEGLRVIPVTVHHSVAQAIKALTTTKIVDVAETTARELSTTFGVSRPRLAIAALNPHAGEEGALGREEIEIIAPAIRLLKNMGLEVTGPAPVDTLFHPAARARYDAALCMLHDHALLPLKTLDFDRGVNITLGLPIIRTSPDHGTAFDIVGKGVAKPDSLIAAIRMAAQLARTAR